MDLLAPFRRKAAAVTPAPRAATQSVGGGVLIETSQQLDEYLRTGNSASAAGVMVTPETALRVAAVYGSVRIRSGTVANMPLGLKRKVDSRTRQDATDNPLQAVLARRPNRWMTASSFRRMLECHVLLRGAGFALIVRNFRGEVIELIPLHPDRVKVEQRADLSLVYRYRRKDGGEQTFQQSDVFHLIGPTFDGITGLSILSYARETIGLATAIQQHGSSFFENGTSLGAVLKHPGKLGNEGVETLKDSLDNYRGSENANKTLVLEEGMSFERIGMSAVDAQFVEAIKATRTDIAMFFGVPPFMLGDTEKSTSWGSGLEQQAQGYVAYTAEDSLTAWEQTIDRDLIPANEPDLFARFNRAALVRGDIKTRYGAYAIGRNGGWLSANDIRANEDLNPIDGGDVYLLPLNMTTADTQDEEKPNEPA